MRDALNTWLDKLPSTRVGSYGQETPTFLACGVTGFYVALIVLFGGGLVTGRSLLVLAVLALVSALSFFVYTYLRMWIVGREVLVLLEHVWFALICDVVALRLMHEPLLPYLDLVAVSLCPFLAAGRVGCTLVGCCHGRPSSVGIRYTDDCARDGFVRHLVGVRLFPVAAIEAVGLLIIGTTGFAALPRAEPGKVIAWYLIAYSVMRFGLEGLRGDERPHLMNMSQARWMSIVEAGFAVILEAGQHRVAATNMISALLIVLFGVLAFRWLRDPRRSLLAPSHVAEVRDFIRHAVEDAGRVPMTLPMLRTTSRQVSIAVSTGLDGVSTSAHVSMALAGERPNLPLLAELAVRALPGLVPDATGFADDRVLCVLTPLPIDDTCLDDAQLRARVRASYGSAVRRLQQNRGWSTGKGRQEPFVPSPTPSAIGPPIHVNAFHAGRTWYFADFANRDR